MIGQNPPTIDPIVCSERFHFKRYPFFNRFAAASIRMLNTFRYLFILVFLHLDVSLSMAQWPFNYIPDWPRQFFSNLDLMSDESMMTSMEEPSRINFRSTFRFDDLYQEKIEPGIERTIYSWTLTHDFEYPLNVFRSKVRIGAHYQSYEKKIDYEFNTNESFHIINEAKTYSLSVAIQPWPEYLEFDIRVGKKSLDSEVYFPWKGGLGFTWKKYFQLRYDKGLDYFVWDYQIQFRQPAINLSVPEKADIDQVLFSVPVFPRLEFNALLRINSLNDQQEFDKNRTTLILVGDQYHRWLSIAFKSKPTMVWSFNYRTWQTDIDGYFYDQGQVFGKFTKRQDVQGAIAAKFKDLVEPDDFAGLCRPFLSQGSACLHILKDRKSVV